MVVVWSCAIHAAADAADRTADAIFGPGQKPPWPLFSGEKERTRDYDALMMVENNHAGNVSLADAAPAAALWSTFSRGNAFCFILCSSRSPSLRELVNLLRGKCY